MLPKLWITWLHLAVIGLMLFGLALLLSPTTAHQIFSLVIYGTPNAIQSRFPADAVAYVQLAHGVIGALMFGWGATMFLVLRGPFLRGERAGWLMLVAPLALWWVTDTAFSLATGFWQNAILNTAVAVLFAIPLAATRRQMR